MANDAGAVRCARPRNHTSRPRLRLLDQAAAVPPRRSAEISVASVSYPGKPASVSATRRFVRDALVGSPRLDDLELIVAELATNAIQHTPSGADGGTYTITVMAMPDGARIEVADLGGGCGCGDAGTQADALSEYGRGLQIVSALADKAGHDITTGRQHLAWAEILWLAELNRLSSDPVSLLPGSDQQ